MVAALVTTAASFFVAESCAALFVCLQVLELVNRAGQFSLQDLADSNMSAVLDTWLDTFQHQLAPAAADDEDVVNQSQLIPAADRQPWAASHVWLGLKVLLGLMQVSCSMSCC